MCVAIPGKVIARDGSTAKVDFNGNIVNVNAGLVDPQIGQYVLVHAGCAIEVMEKDAAQEIIDIFADIEEIENGN
ncbi:MAG: HypC/HybG/HupF family hydrogenase formation chaperone [Firmicutes bacterium]|nr:HypC/HybG/HupF family hydrogenase formation chaperone [Bacillota bacterium]